MSDCYKCGYRRTLLGDCHSGCAFDFEGQQVPPPKGNPHGIRNGWWLHPFSFDPVWMMGDCLGFAETADAARVREFSTGLGALLGFFARR